MTRSYQMTDEAAEETYRCIQKVDLFEGIKRMDLTKHAGMAESVSSKIA